MFPKATARIETEIAIARRQADRHAAFINRAGLLADAVRRMTTTYGPYSLVRCGDDAFLALTTDLDDAVAWWCDSEQEGFRDDKPWPATANEVFDAMAQNTKMIWYGPEDNAGNENPPIAEFMAELHGVLTEATVLDVCEALGIPVVPV